MKIDKRVVPHIFTFGNLCMGMLAIMIAVMGQPLFGGLSPEIIGSLLIILAAVLDRYDGKIARHLGVESDFGKELDSLSDLVSFGLAPSLIAWHLGLRDLGWVGIIIPLLFLSAGAFRLARYNITATSGGNTIFTGVPITVAGALLSAYTIYVVLADAVQRPSLAKFTVFFMIALSYLMVSKLRIRKR